MWSSKWRNAAIVALEHFGCWLASEHLVVEELARVTIRSFLTDHLPACRCPGPAPTTLRFVRAALTHMMRLPGRPMQRPRPHTGGHTRGHSFCWTLTGIQTPMNSSV